MTKHSIPQPVAINNPKFDKSYYCNGCKWLTREENANRIFYRCSNFGNGDWCGRTVGRPNPAEIADRQWIETPAWCTAGKEEQ